MLGLDECSVWMNEVALSHDILLKVNAGIRLSNFAYSIAVFSNDKVYQFAINI